MPHWLQFILYVIVDDVSGGECVPELGIEDLYWRVQFLYDSFVLLYIYLCRAISCVLILPDPS